MTFLEVETIRYMYTIIFFTSFVKFQVLYFAKKNIQFLSFSLLIIFAISACLHTLIVSKNVNYNLQVPTNQTNLKTNKINWIKYSILPPRTFLKFVLLSLPVGPMANIINRCLVKSAAMISSCFSRLNLQH